MMVLGDESFALQRAKLPKLRKKRPSVPLAVANEMKRYTDAYRRVYGKPVVLTYDRDFGFIRGATSAGVGVKRLKELTAQLRERAKDL